VRVLEVRWGKGGTEPERGIYVFLRTIELNYIRVSLCRITSAVTRVEFVSDRMSYIAIRGRWCRIFVLNVHIPREDKIYNVNDSFYEALVRELTILTKRCCFDTDFRNMWEVPMEGSYICKGGDIWNFGELRIEVLVGKIVLCNYWVCEWKLNYVWTGRCFLCPSTLYSYIFQQVASSR
jgi:hypothetical protein